MVNKLQYSINKKAKDEILLSIEMLDNAQDVLIAIRDEGKFEPVPSHTEIQQAINDMEKIRLTLYHAHGRIKAS
jgi:hypothetical protein